MPCGKNMATTTPIDLHYRIEGPSGAPVLMLSHALGLSMAMWDPQVAALSREFRVVRYDHRVHGGTPEPDVPFPFHGLPPVLLPLLHRRRNARRLLVRRSLGAGGSLSP